MYKKLFLERTGTTVLYRRMVSKGFQYNTFLQSRLIALSYPTFSTLRRPAKSPEYFKILFSDNVLPSTLLSVILRKPFSIQNKISVISDTIRLEKTLFHKIKQSDSNETKIITLLYCTILQACVHFTIIGAGV